MQEILFLLLPLAFYSGWNAARKRNRQQQQTQTPAPSPQFVRGINFLLNEEPDKALDIFLQAPVIESQTAETFLLLGNMFRNRGEVNRALRVHQHLVARPDLNNSQRQAAMLALGEDFFAAGMLDRAENVFREIIEHYPDNAQAAEPLLHIYEQLQDWDKAIALSERAGQDKNRFIAHYYCEKAEAYIQENQLYKADENLKKAHSAYAASARVKVLQAELALARHDYGAAFNHFRAALEKDPRLPGRLAPRLLEIYGGRPELAQWYLFFKHHYELKPDAHLFPVLLDFAQASAHTAELEPLIQAHFSAGPVTLQTVARSLQLLQQQAVPTETFMPALSQGLNRLAQADSRFQCGQCGYKMQDYLWRCPACQRWDSVVSN